MNPFMSHDRLENARESVNAYKQEKDEWIRNKADELSTKWPELLDELISPFLISGIGLAHYGSDMQDAYAEMVEKICLAEAQKQAKEHEFLNGTFREVV
ncbi:Uncharacterised protein [Yersinia rohdei]|uniref:hypothetical protein n=1 Tax=Yersinia rohdei TaxID=29485 RepID=UPI0005E3D7A5|nr:hypothetical protein [Yersinia rohdei]CNJ55434.1 Uncharacterised protein [Yersinia rohdei]